MIAEASPSSLAAWESFYVIVGSSAGALTGLQFVVIALIADQRQRATHGQLDAFATPTIVHFCAALLISAILSAPWPSFGGVAWVLGITGIWGIAYTAIVFIRARRVTGYHPVLEDWVWHVTLPFLSYIILLVGAFTLRGDAARALFMIASMAVLLVLIGIHNAWDSVTFIVVEKLHKADEPKSDSST